MANEQISIGGQLHMLAFCAVVCTPTEGANKGKPFQVQRRTGFDVKGDAASVYLVGPDGAPLGTGVGETKPEWTVDTELDEVRRLQRHLGGGSGAGYRFVHFDMTLTHAAPGRAKITDLVLGCLLLQDPTTGKAGDNTTIKMGGPSRAFWPNGIDPLDAAAALGGAA